MVNGQIYTYSMYRHYAINWCIVCVKCTFLVNENEQLLAVISEYRKKRQ